MSIQISYEVSDRAEVEDEPGLHAVLYFRRSTTEPPVSITGTSGFTESLLTTLITVRDDEIGLPPDLADQLLREVCEAGWNAIVVDGMAAVGVHWRDFAEWATERFPAPNAASVIDETTRAVLAKADGQRSEP